MRNFLTILFLFIGLSVSPVWGADADETLVRIAEEGNYSYFKPEVKIHPSGSVYVSYTAISAGSGIGDIFLSKYENGKVSFVKNVSDSGNHSYESEIDIDNNGGVHVTWCDQSGETHVIKYRYFSGTSWSGTTTLGQVTDTENIEDLRISVDPAGNVFVVFMHWPAAKCKIISKYGNNISFENFPLSGRSKHPDVAADGNYVHVVFQYREAGDEYTIAYDRRPNSRGSNWESWIDLEYYGVQRPRMSLDRSGNPHVVFFRNFGSTRIGWYKKRQGNKFGDLTRMTDPNNDETYHFLDIVAIDDDYVLVSMQRGGHSGGKFVGYNWKEDGKWSGYSFFEKSYGPRPTKQSIDVSPEHLLAACAFAHKDEEVYLLLVEAQSASGGTAPIARFSYSPQTGHAPLDVTFDATESTDPDGSVKSYNWSFGDGQTGGGQTIPHRFLSQGTYSVTLTVTDNSGKSGSVSHTVIVEPPNQPPVAKFTFSPLRGLYPLPVTFDASTSFDTDGSVEQYDWDFGGEETGTGRVVQHTFPEEGIYNVVLTAIDDDGDTATASGTVEVLGVLPPLNINTSDETNRNLFTIQYVSQVTWDPNPGNPERGANIAQYKIYRKRKNESSYSYLATVSALEENLYYDRIGTVREEFDYTVTAVDDQGRESKLPDGYTPPEGYKKDPVYPGKI